MTIVSSLSDNIGGAAGDALVKTVAASKKNTNLLLSTMKSKRLGDSKSIYLQFPSNIFFIFSPIRRRVLCCNPSTKAMFKLWSGWG